LVCLAMWLFMAAAEAWTPLHAWLHGGVIPDNDDCPIAMLHQGKVDNTVVAMTVAVVVGLAISTLAVFSSQFIPSLPLPNVRGPPICRLAIAPA
jgi:hypothetical protein